MQDASFTEIERAHWADYANEFNRRNLGRTTRLEIFGELGAQEEERHLPFNGLALDLHGHDAPRLAIMLGDDDLRTTPASAARRLTHMVPRVTRLWPKRAADGSDEALAIESASGEKTLLRFERWPPPPV